MAAVPSPLRGLPARRGTTRVALGGGATLTFGLAFGAAGPLLLARASVTASYALDVLLALLMFGDAGGLVFNPLLLEATGDDPPEDADAAAGFVNSSTIMGGALSLGALVTVAGACTRGLGQTGREHSDALNGGHHLAFAVSAGLRLVAWCSPPCRTSPWTRTRTGGPRPRAPAAALLIEPVTLRDTATPAGG